MAAMANQSHERAFGVTNIKSQIPLILNLDDHSYDAWRELFLTHCLTFDVLGHIDSTFLPANANDAAWYKRDGLVKLCIYGTLARPLFRSSFKTGGSSRDVWLRVENQFRNNKEAKAIQLDNELHNQEIGDRSIKEYCQKIKSLADLLTNVDAPLNERTMVTYLLNGLNDKFDNIINVIKQKDPFPSFETAKSMLELEENRLMKSHRHSATHKDHSSSTTALTVAAAPSTPRQPHHQNYTDNRGYTGNRGNKHNYRNRGGDRQNNNNTFRPSLPNWPTSSYWHGPYPFWPNYFGNWSPFPHNSMRPSMSSPPQPAYPQAHLMEIQLGTPTTETLVDPNGAPWIMDTGSMAHLSSSSGPSNSEDSAPM
ncbi:PREDICTED: uncharacterized protein LOC104720326 [Camelina sativa]|uniref:Uncharacterized protein LOC104720326 n=1 Tax=Camelina sativa TaxID=90675 RepID=A0ABM0U6B3_CAMSA|nr:PREDICTED: uncharacterized protein LOC104720326 [Camelina sativa]